MTTNSKATKEQLLKMIDQLQKNPDDKVRLLGDTGITIVGAGLGATAAGTVASAVGATSIFGLTTAASWFGVAAVSATPVGWVLGIAAVGGLAAYGVSRLVRDGGLAEGRKQELLQQYHETLTTWQRKKELVALLNKTKQRSLLPFVN